MKAKAKELSEKLNLISEMLAYKKENEFKARAYQIAARAIEEMSDKDLEELVKKNEVEKISGVGSSLAQKILEYYKTDKISFYEELKSSLPQGVYEMLREPSIGPKRTKILYEEMNIKSLKDLKKAAEEGKLAQHEGFGEKIQANILKALKKENV